MTAAAKQEPDKLATRLARVMGAIHGVKKDGRNDFHKYDYATSDAVLFEVRKALSLEGVCFMCGVDEVMRDERAAKNGVQFHITLKLAMAFHCGETGESLTTTWYSEATDTGDKAINKAQTAGVKYFLLKAFLIPTSDEPDADAVSPEPVTARKNEAQGLTFAAAKAAIATAETDAERAKVTAQIKAAKFSQAQVVELRRLFNEAKTNGAGKMAQVAARVREPGEDDDWGEVVQ
jgi:hypothetical protein